MTKERIDVQQHFVTFYSPGTFMAEDRSEPIDAWDVDEALRRATAVKERYGATPYGFRFSTRGRGANELDSRLVASSPMHYFGVVVETLATLKERNHDGDRILIQNMECNGWARVVRTINGWSWSQPLLADDIVLDDARVKSALGQRPASAPRDGATK